MEKTVSVTHAEEKGAGAAQSGGDPERPVREVKPYSTRKWGELARMELKPRIYFWGELFALGQLHVMFGQGGLGKSRISLNLARNQVLNLPFCGMPTGERPLKHLLMGSENSIHRLQDDVRKMSIGLKEEQVALLEEHVHLATLEGPEDAFINVGDEQNLERWGATIAETRPDVVWIDPWGDILMGDGTDRDVRETLTAVQKLVRRVNPEAGLVVTAHSRTGTQNILLAGGYGAPDFGKGSKALYSAARAVVNLAPFDGGPDPEIVTVCAKLNDAAKFPPFKMKMSGKTHTYESAGTFDLEVWQEKVRAAGADKRKKARATMKPKIDFTAINKALREKVSGGPVRQTELIAYLESDFQLAKGKAKETLKDATQSDKKFLFVKRSKTMPSYFLCSLIP